MKNPFKIHYKDVMAFAMGRLLGAWSKKRFARRLQVGTWRPTQDRVANAQLPSRSANAGFVLFGQPLELEPWLDRLERLGDQLPNHFSEQTLVHLALTQSGALPLDPERFILATDDLFWFRDKYASRSNIICRHYTGPVRHKFWILAV